MNTVTVEEVVALQAQVIAESGGLAGIIDLGRIESAVAQPQMSFGGIDVYPSVATKAAALAYSLARNHGFADGNKRIAHAALELFLARNGYDLLDEVDEQEAIFLRLAAGTLTRTEFAVWVAKHLQTADELP